MAQNVKFYLGTRKQYNNMASHNPLALYFCEDTGELFRGSQCISDGIRVIPTIADLPEFSCAADGIVYYVRETRNGYTLSPDRTEWLQTIYAPVTDAYQVPESEVYNTVTTVGAVRDIENAIYTYIDQEIANIEISGSAGKDGLSAYEIWLNDGHTGTESDFLTWLKGKDGVDGADGKDGLNGKDGVSGKDGKSAYETWIDAGHSGSEDDFLQWLKSDNDQFGDVVTSIGFDGIAAGTSLKGKTVKDVLVMLLGIQEAPKSAVEEIMSNQIPCYSGVEYGEVSEVAYQHLDAATASYTDQGFYTTTDANGNITNAGYQMVMDGNAESLVQTFSMLSTAKIITTGRLSSYSFESCFA